MIVSAQSRPKGHPGYAETLPGLEESAGAARSLVRTVLVAWGMERLTDAGTLLVSELVANAVKHTDSHHIRVVVSRPGAAYVRIGVVDRSRSLPEVKRPNGDDLSAGGRGLVLIDGLADRWGTDLYRRGKRVWSSCGGRPSGEER